MNEVPLYRMRATLHCCPARGQQLEVLFYVHLENEKPRTKCGVDEKAFLCSRSRPDKYSWIMLGLNENYYTPGSYESL